jgi:RNA polymerase sigma factor (sigma-70 family)
MTSDLDLLRLARKDRRHFGELAERHIEPLYRWLLARTRDPQVAADLTAETLAQALASLGRFREPTSESAAPWLFGIAHNLLLRYYRTQRAEAAARRRLGMPLTAQTDDDYERVLSQPDDGERARLAEALASLPPEQRAAVDLRIGEELSYAEIAGRLGCSPGAARVRVSRAIARLQTLWQGVLP